MAGYKYWGGIIASTFIGLMFVTAGFGKLPHQGEYWGLIVFDYFDSTTLLRLTDIVKKWLPWVEIIFGSLLIVGIASKIVTSFFSVLIFGFMVNNIWMISNGAGREPCGCFGKFEEFLGTLSAKSSLVMDLGMLVLVWTVFMYYPGNFFRIKPWFLQGHLRDIKE
jgi:uncharacterized membrane protein YphA (DoxX/SURF4 family)